MAQLRVRIELKRPRKGIELAKLIRLAEEAQKFLRMVAEDVGIKPDDGIWVAENFYNQGIGFDNEFYFSDVDHAQVASYVHAVDVIASIDREQEWRVRGVRPLTVLQSAKMAAIADDDEVVRLGLLRNEVVVDGLPDVEWRPLPKARAHEIIEFYQESVEYRGMLQGLIHSLFKEAAPPYFTLRDFASGELVRCEFKAADWPSLHHALTRKDGVVLVAGWLRVKRVDKAIEVMRVDKIQGTKPVSRDELQAFFGSAPGWTGDMTTDEFIKSLRTEDDAE
jgi:hypothetical protein